MMGTKTSNFSDQVASEEEEHDTTRREESTRKTIKKTPIDFIRRSSAEGCDDLRDSTSIQKSNLNPLKSLWSSRKTAITTVEANQPCIVELRCAKNLPVMGSDDDGTNPFVTMKVASCIIFVSVLSLNNCIRFLW